MTTLRASHPGRLQCHFFLNLPQAMTLRPAPATKVGVPHSSPVFGLEWDTQHSTPQSPACHWERTPDFLPRCAKHRRVKFANATNPDRKSGGSRWICSSADLSWSVSGAERPAVLSTDIRSASLPLRTGPTHPGSHVDNLHGGLPLLSFEACRPPAAIPLPLLMGRGLSPRSLRISWPPPGAPFWNIFPA
jgi:hypothetical protein